MGLAGTRFSHRFNLIHAIRGAGSCVDRLIVAKPKSQGTIMFESMLKTLALFEPIVTWN